MKKRLRMAWGAGVLVWGMASVVCAQSPAATASRAQVLLSSGGIGAAGGQANPSGEVLREIVDPHNGEHWLLLRQNTLPGGPGRLVLVASDRGDGIRKQQAQSTETQVRMRLGTHSSSQPDLQSTLIAPALPVIRSGDRLTVEEHTAHVDAVLEARALGAAVAGAVLEARLTIGGGVVRVVALGPGRAALAAGDGSTAMRARRMPELGKGLGAKIGTVLFCGVMLLAGTTAGAGEKKIPFLPAAKPTPPEAALKTYIERVRAQQAAEVLTPGSIWSPEGRLVRLGTDAKAVRLHDVVSIVVTESLAASTDGQVKNSRASNASSGLTSLIGLLKARTNCRIWWA